jgi:hypothetical protein
MTINLRQAVAPVVEPVTLALAKQHLRIDATNTLDDALISTYLVAARQYAEKYTHRAFFAQQWVLSLDHFPAFLESGTLPIGSHNEWPYFQFYWEPLTIRLPWPTTVSVESITYTDLTGTVQTLDPATYYADVSSEPARIIPRSNMFWPYAQQYIPGSVQVAFTAATYTASTCPQSVTLAVLMLAAQWYENREAVAATSMTVVPQGVLALLDAERFDYIWR